MEFEYDNYDEDYLCIKQPSFDLEPLEWFEYDIESAALD